MDWNDAVGASSSNSNLRWIRFAYAAAGMRRWIAAGAWWAVVSAQTAPVRAEEPPPVLLRLDKCEDLDETEIRRITAAELGARSTDSGGDDVTEVNVACDMSHVVIRVRDPLSRKAVQRSFNLGLSEPRARSRLVAIAATELVLASWSELQTNPTLHVEPEGPAPPAPSVRAARQIAREEHVSPPYQPKLRTWYDADTPEDRSFRIVALASTRSFFSHPGTLWGGGVRVGEERFRFLSWSADLLLERGTIGSSEGQFEVSTTTLGGALFLSGRTGPLTGRLGAGLRVGFAATAPHDQQSSGGPALAPWGWPLGTASLSMRLAPELVIDVSCEAGYVVLPIQGPSDNDKSISGGWYSAQFGIGYVPRLSSRLDPAAAVAGAEE